MKQKNVVWMWFMLMCMTLGFVSCDSTDDENGIPGGSEALVGKWQLKEASAYEIINGVREDLTADDFDYDGYLEFSSDGTAVNYSGSENDYFNWRLEGNHIICTGAEDWDYTIESLTDKELIVTQNTVRSNGDRYYERLVMERVGETGGNENLDPSKSPLSKVFTGKLLKTLDDDAFVYENGFLAKIMDADGETTTFTYNYLSGNNTSDYDVTVVCTNGDDWTLNVKLNKQGFAEDIYQWNADRDYADGGFSSEKHCTYDAEGHLIAMKDSKEERDYTFDWEDGNLVYIKTVCYQDEDPTAVDWTSEHCFTYSEALNSNNLMFYYRIYDVDIDEVDCLYWAGLLGTAPKNLVTELTGKGNTPYKFTWTETDVTVSEGYSDHIAFSFQD